MTIDDAPMDELDLAIRREADALRVQVGSSAHTDTAWEDFGFARSATVISLEDVVVARRRWRIAVAVGMVAALIAAVVIVREIRDNPTKLPIIGPPSSTTVVAATASGFATLTLRNVGGLNAIGPDRTEHPIAGVPSPAVDSFVQLDVSATGWVAETGIASNGFWFFQLRDPAGSRHFVDIAELPGGRTSRGAWSPDGTLYATVESGTTLVIVHPDTRVVTRLPSAHPPIGHRPTWTADGSGILAGQLASPCVTNGDTAARTLTIIPIDGSPEITAIPALADGMNHVTTGGLWSNDNQCGTFYPTDAQPSLSDVVVVGPNGTTSWFDAPNAPARLRQSVFATTRQELWVLAERDRVTRVVDLYRASAPHDVHVVNTLGVGVDGESKVYIAAVAPDDTAVVVLVSGVAQRAFYLVPTDGSPTTALDGEFAGFVPMSLVDELGS
jgi:hypothetical protein